MADRPSDPIEQVLRGLVRRERLANTASLEATRKLEEYLDRIDDLVRRVDPTAPKARRYRKLREKKLLDAIDDLLVGLPADLEKTIRDLLAPIGREAALGARLDLRATLGTFADSAEIGTLVVPVTENRVRSILRTDPIRGLTLPEHMQRIGANVGTETRRAIRTGMVAEESIPKIVRRVDRWARGKALRQTRALVRTAVTFVSSTAHLETYRANADVLETLQFVATLDDRTTTICLDLDGTEWAPGDSGIVVPGADTHYQCRSVLAPNPDWKKLGVDAPPEGFRVARKSPTGDGKVGKIERISSTTTAETWLRDQSRTRVRRILGKTRGDLFVDGKVSLSDLVRDDRTTVPLRELLGR